MPSPVNLLFAAASPFARKCRVVMRCDIGDIALVCALSYVDLRHGAFEWRRGRPNLAALIERLEQRRSFVETKV
jgi:hypothetical protein